MSEQCLLSLHTAAQNEKYLWEGDIPRNCLDCIQREVDKPFNQIKLGTIGVELPVNILDSDKTVAVGLTYTDVHGRRAQLVNNSLPAPPGDKDHTYITFYCAQAALSPAKQKPVTDIDASKYL
jgi:hypothetical protein